MSSPWPKFWKEFEKWAEEMELRHDWPSWLAQKRRVNKFLFANLHLASNEILKLWRHYNKWNDLNGYAKSWSQKQRQIEKLAKQIKGES